MTTMGWEVGWGDYSIEIGVMAEIRASLKDGDINTLLHAMKFHRRRQFSYSGCEGTEMCE